MLNLIFKSIITFMVLILVSACGGGSSNSSTPPTVINTNNKTVYFESDFNTDSSLRVTANDLAIFTLDNNAALTEKIPFSISQAGEYELCLEGADNILEANIKDSQGNSALEIAPVYSLNCLSASLQVKDYFLELNYVNLISYEINAQVPFVRLGEKIETKDSVDTSDWNAQMLAEISRAGLTSLPQNTMDSYDLRTCYTTPKSNSSIALFRMDSKKLRLSYKPDLSTGVDYLCTYQLNYNFLGVGDLGDIDAIIAGYINRSIVSSRPRAGNQSVSILSDIKIQFKGSINSSLTNKGFSLSPSVAGTVNVNGQVLQFIPSSPLTADTTYTITLQGLTENSQPIENINFSFKTEKTLTLTGNETSLSDEQLCALEVSEFCVETYYSTITNIAATISGSTVTGSRFLQVTTTLEQATLNDIAIEYEMIDNRDQSVITSDLFVIGFGETTGSNLIAWPIDDFERTAHSVSMNITKISNAFGILQNAGNWTAYNGELYNSPSDVVTNEAGAPTITNITLSGNISTQDLSLNVAIDVAASEDVYIDFDIANGCQWTGPGVSEDYCLKSGVVTIPAGDLNATVTLKEPGGLRIVSISPIVVTVAHTRNVNEGASGLSATKLLDATPVTPGPDPGPL